MFSQLQTYIESQLAGNNFHPFIFLLLVLGGFLASLLPCVYPLYPITAGILKSRTDKIKWLHPVIYYLGLATMYLLFGLIAGLTGGIFNAILRFPETNVALAYILFVLGLSSAEFIHLPFFGQKTANTKLASLSGSFLLGMGAGLLSSPCVGPVVVSILLQLVSHAGENISFFLILSTSLKMFAFGLGVGIPFLAIGVFGMSLPKSGRWLRSVQYSLAVLIFYFSYTYLLKAGASWKWEEGKTEKVFLLWCLLLTASYHWQEHADFIALRMKRALSLATIFLISICLLIVLLSKSLLSDQIQNINASTEIEQSGNLTWYRSKELAFKRAKAENKHIFVDFYADWCTNCKEFQKLTISNQLLNEALANNAILYKVYDTDEAFENYANDPRFPELKIGLPFFLILDENGNLIFKTNDYLAITAMVNSLKQK